MRVLGVDPGIRHTGVVVLDDDSVVLRATLMPKGKGRLSIEDVLNHVLPRLWNIVSETDPEAAVVEQVTFYGKSRRITLPLSHISGAIAGFLASWHMPVFCLTATMRRGTPVPRGSAGWDEHQRDAAVLAKVGQAWLNAFNATDSSYLQKHAAAGRRILTVPKPVPIVDLEKGKQRKRGKRRGND